MPITRLNNDNPTNNQAPTNVAPKGTAAKPVSLQQDSYTSSAVAAKPKPSPHKGLLGDFEAVAHKLESFITVVIFANAIHAIDDGHKQEQKRETVRKQDAKDAAYAQNAVKIAQQANANQQAAADPAKHAN